MTKHSGDTANIISSHSKKRKHIIMACSFLVLAVILVVCAIFGKQVYSQYQKVSTFDSVVDASTFYKGIVVQGVDLSGKTMEQATAAVKAIEPSLRDKYNIKVTYGDKNWEITEDDFTFAYDTDQVLKEAYNYARTGSKEERYKLISALTTTPKTYQISHTMTYDSLKTKLSAMVKGIAYAPVDATVASFNTDTATFTYKDGKDGLSVNENKLYADVEKIINGSKTGTVPVPTAKIPFGVTAAQVKSHMQQLGTFNTYSTNTANGNHNMRIALGKANGLSILPGATFSFNGMTGNSTTAENGYLKAGAISGGKSIQEYGGGICQVSTTMYGAALRSNMEIVSRYNHMWPSTYCPIGLDATVSYPYLDFKFKNPTAYPIYIVAGMSGTKLTVTFYGYQSPDYDNIAITSQQTETIPMPTAIYKVDSSLATGAKKLDITGKVGKRATAQRTFYKNGKVVKTESLLSSYYSAVAPVYLVGPGTTAPSGSSSNTSSSKASSSSAASSKPSSSHSSTSSNSAAE